MAKIQVPFVRNPYNYDRNEASDESGLSCPEQTLAKQEFAEESDINYIANRYGLTGEMPQVLQLPQYGDFADVFDFQSAQNAVILARQQFMTLPAKMRARFNNDPQQLLTFLNDPENKDEAIFLGLVQKQDTMTDTATPAALQGAKHEAGSQSNTRQNAPEKTPDAGAQRGKGDATPDQGT